MMSIRNLYNRFMNVSIDETTNENIDQRMDVLDETFTITDEITMHENDNTVENMSNYIMDLSVNGYTVIPNVYSEEEIKEYWSEFNKWRESVPDLEHTHNILSSAGIFKHHQVGHQRFAWLARTNPKIVNIFKQLWDTDKLVTSFDGCCYYPENYAEEPSYWTHTDQSSQKKGLRGYQSFLSLTNNTERTFVVYKGSHLLHENYFKYMEIDDPKDWNIIDRDYIDTIYYKQEIISVKAGDLVIWDSRTFHQNTCGDPDCGEERLVQYLCYLPKNHPDNDSNQMGLRMTYFNTLRTTNHLPYPMCAVSKQPNTYNYYNPAYPIVINYKNLPKPELTDMLLRIYELL